MARDRISAAVPSEEEVDGCPIPRNLLEAYTFEVREGLHSSSASSFHLMGLREVRSVHCFLE